MENIVIKLRTTDKWEKQNVWWWKGKKNTLKQNEIGHLKIWKYKFERVYKLKCLEVMFVDDNNHQIHLQERIKNTNKTYFIQQFFKKKIDIS
jgi:hypothetical protein